MRIVFSALLIFQLYLVGGQILNIDRQNRSDTAFKKNKLYLNVGFNIDKQRRNLFEFVSQIENNHFFKKKSLVWITLAYTDVSLNGVSILENNGYFQMRLRDNDTRRYYPDYYIQYQWNGIWGLENRGIAGANLRFRFKEEEKVDCYSGIGLFYEYEKWNPFLSSFAFKQDSLAIVYRSLPRLNFMVKSALHFKEVFDLSGSMYVQFPITSQISDFIKPRWFADLNLFITVSKHISVKIHYDHNFDTFRALPIESWYYNLNTGFQFKL